MSCADVADVVDVADVAGIVVCNKGSVDGFEAPPSETTAATEKVELIAAAVMVIGVPSFLRKRISPTGISSTPQAHLWLAHSNMTGVFRCSVVTDNKVDDLVFKSLRARNFSSLCTVVHLEISRMRTFLAKFDKSHFHERLLEHLRNKSVPVGESSFGKMLVGELL